MKAPVHISILLLTITLASCQISQEACLPSSSPWAQYEKAIDASQNCEQIHSVYIAFCKRLIALDGQISPEYWKEYVKTTNFLERKMNRKSRRFCGCTYFDNIIEAAPAMGDGEGEEPLDDFDFEMWEDNFDYDEFDSSR